MGNWFVRLVVLSLIVALSGPLAPVGSVQAVAPGGAWSNVAPLTSARFRHTSTLLDDGRVLVAGGGNGGSSFDAAELFDPTTSSWSVTDSLAAERESHTATRLLDGRVLVVGGERKNQTFPTTTSRNSVEIYDPVSATWDAAAPLATARSFHTATLLPDGRVLVVGGHTWVFWQLNAAVLDTVELYDPAADAWTSGGTLSTPRSGHSATLLADGRVLVAGGSGATAELFDPASKTWSATGSMGEGRRSHFAVLLQDGRVIVGGSGSATSTEVYSPATGTWSAVGNLASYEGRRTATLLPDGRVLVAGGYNSNRVSMASELFDPNANTWSVTHALSSARIKHAATLLADGRVLVTGGWIDCGNFCSLVAQSEVYNPFASASVILIDDAGTASPYPSSIAVSGVSGTIRDVNVTLRGLSHPDPDDLDILLVGPTGLKTMLMSDAGGTTGVSGAVITFDATAAVSIPDSTAITSGAYKPTNYTSSRFDAFPPPAPAGPYGVNLNQLAGTNPNGTWQLFIVDDASTLFQIFATLGGWSLSILTDSMDPVTGASFKPVPNAAGWTRFNTTVTLAALDEEAGSGVASLMYSATGAQPIAETTVNVAQHPLVITAQGTTTITFRASDVAGNQTPDRTVVVTLDKTKPAVVQPIKVRLRVNVALGSGDTLPAFLFNWSGNDPGAAASGLHRYRLRQSINGGALQGVSLATPLATTRTRNLNPANTIQYTLDAVDVAGNVSTPAVTPTLLADLRQETDASIVDTGSWATQGSANVSGGTTQFASTAGHTATFSFVGTSIGWVSIKGWNRGIAEVRVDGVLKETVDLYNATVQVKRVVFVLNNLPDGAHTIEIKVLGTKNVLSGGTRVDVDAFELLDPISP